MDRNLIAQFQDIYKSGGLTDEAVAVFRKIILKNYEEQGRSFPWRETRDPYHILISEVMLQQTQTARVVSKYLDFIARFPDFGSLAEATLFEVLQSWQGLGYNRRAKSLHQLAKTVMTEYNGRLPETVEQLLELPGIGPYTASAVAAIAFGIPAVAIDTNIRTVYHYFFFNDEDSVKDSELESLIQETIDKHHPREWYYALYDFGVMLKQEEKGKWGVPKYRQSRFKGSDRQIRGQVLKMLLGRKSMTIDDIKSSLDFEDERIERIIRQIQDEEFIIIEDGNVRIRE